MTKECLIAKFNSPLIISALFRLPLVLLRNDNASALRAAAHLPRDSDPQCRR